MGKYPSMSGGGMSIHLPPDAEYSYPQDKGPSPSIEGWLHTLYPK